MRRSFRAFIALVCALAVLAGASFAAPAGAALAEDSAAGALIVPVTPKPWQRLQATAELTAEPTAEPTQSAAQTMPPSSLSEMEEDLPALPTQAPAVQTALPEAIQALENAALTDDPLHFRVLLIGTDSYRADQRGRSDTMVLLQVNVQTGEIKMVSFLRDLYVHIPGHGSTRLNAAYVYGGADLLKETLAENFGVTADCTLAVNFSLMVTLMDRIGGVWVEVSESERRQLNSILKFYNTWNGYKQSDQLLDDSGLQLLTGKQALCYSRIRKIDSDFQRTGRQRKVLMGIYERVRELDALTLAEILRESYGEISTDLTLEDVATLLPLLYQLNSVTFDSLTVPVNGGYRNETVRGSDVLMPDLSENCDAIANFLW